MTDTTAQLRQTISKLVISDTMAYEKAEKVNEAMQAIADYISQLELPEKKGDYGPDTNAQDSGYNQAIDDTATTLQKAAEQLRRTQ